MKPFFTLSFLMLTIGASSQWSSTNNLFADSLHMPVAVVPLIQTSPLTVRSYPDSGYFVIWEDYRSSPTNSIRGLYAQKYSKEGVAQWSANGVAISSSTNNQHYTTVGITTNNHSYAATDSANGFYLAYADDSLNGGDFERVCIQHIKPNGDRVFAGAGQVLYTSLTSNFHMSPQLVADGNGGFFVSYLSPSYAGSSAAGRALMYCFKDVNGTLQVYGGGQMNENAVEYGTTGPCGNYRDVHFVDAEVQGDYHIYPDLQGGCDIIMSFSINGRGKFLGYNRLFRAKTNATATEASLGNDFSAIPYTTQYQAGMVYRMHFLKINHRTITCSDMNNVYVVTEYTIAQDGFRTIDGGDAIYDFTFPKGVVISGSGNINASIVASCERSYSPSAGVGNPLVRGYTVREEVYDSIPYERTSNPSPTYPGYNYTAPPSVNKLGYWTDTLLSTAVRSFDFSMGGGSSQAYAAGLLDDNGLTDGNRYVKLQHMAMERITADSFAIVYKTNTKSGVIIGLDDQNYFFTGRYAIPQILVNRQGNALFVIKENVGNTGPVRVSPIFSGAQLAWGAMGRPIGTQSYNGSYYNMQYPYASLDPTNGTGLVAWDDTRNLSTTSDDIYMFHLDNLNDANYLPPYKRIHNVYPPCSAPTTSAVLFGTTNKLTTFETSCLLGPDPGTSPVVEISDNYNLGKVTVSINDNTGSIRTYNGKPYLDRSYTITPEHNPNGAATVTVRLFFTTAEFDKLRAADPTIVNPGQLAVIKQPGTGSGATYTVVAGEQTIIPQSWAAVAGGYYIEIQVTGFSNFFIFKNDNIPLPLTWLGIQAQWQNAAQAYVSWQVAEQRNVSGYTVQQSTNGIDFTDACTVSASAQTQYSCLVSSSSGRNYYRVVEKDVDGRKSYSRIVLLQAFDQNNIIIYPNPVKDVLFINSRQQNGSLQIVDMQGRILKQEKLFPGTQPIDVSRLEKGNYVLKLIGHSETSIFKFTKE